MSNNFDVDFSSLALSERERSMVVFLPKQIISMQVLRIDIEFQMLIAES